MKINLIFYNLKLIAFNTIYTPVKTMIVFGRQLSHNVIARNGVSIKYMEQLQPNAFPDFY